MSRLLTEHLITETDLEIQNLKVNKSCIWPSTKGPEAKWTTYCTHRICFMKPRNSSSPCHGDCKRSATTANASETSMSLTEQRTLWQGAIQKLQGSMEDHKIKKPNLNLASISLAHANHVAGDYSAQNTGDDSNNIDETRSAHMCQGNRENGTSLEKTLKLWSTQECKKSSSSL